MAVEEKVDYHNGKRELTPLAAVEEEKRLVRKIDRAILPITCLLYLLAYLDRSNLGNARLQGLPEEILGGDPKGLLYEWVFSAFYFSYANPIPGTSYRALKAFPSILLDSHYGDWMGNLFYFTNLMLTVLQASAFNLGGIIVCRIGLGVFEAGFGPAIPVYFSLFYTKNELGLRLGYWFGFAAIAGAFGGLIAFGVQSVHFGPNSESDWKLLFLIEGIPAILLGVVTWFALPNRPEATHLFNERERELALERGARGTTADIGLVINRRHIIAALTDWRILACGTIYFGVNCALASISAFLPTIIKTFGYTNALAQLLTVPPYVVGAIVLCMTAYATDRLQSRGLAIASSCAAGAIGYLLVVLVPSNMHVRYFAVFLITSGTYTAIGVIIAWCSETKKAAGIPMFMAIGQCGSVLGANIYPASDGPRYLRGFTITCALMAWATVCAVILYVSYKRDNKRRDELYGKPDPDATVDTSELADKAPMFRYIP
ncbi:major facilitator superfamily domain-containing protein [Pisolithus orientalis]|uniref:major facilitator superfamily domain-containing protein n=1 Tax=Pisolithus orientalis TaxID=936130 RepID=UPI00222537AF|nr:major facilitator superfamily domain-containing protein [Pisolithus orientalis]KAI6019896.1 major facilitator superfamily domain-containing protein [Pisolithus orientalis]